MTLDDAAIGLNNLDLTEEALKERLAKDLGENAERVYQLRRVYYPEVTPYLIQARIATDRRIRKAAMRHAELEADQGGTPVYCYIWERPVPACNGKFGVVHGVDVGASIHIYREPMTGCGFDEGMRMADTFSAAWINLAKSGGPNSEITPDWPAYDRENRSTMVFDLNARVEAISAANSGCCGRSYR